MSFEEGLNKLRETFDDYIKNKVLKMAKLDHLGNNHPIGLFLTSVQKFSTLESQQKAFLTSKDLPVTYLMAVFWI